MGGRRGIVGDQDPVMAPLLLSYGKALFELAVSQAGVMGKEEAPREEEDDGKLPHCHASE
jgi:HAT1-interacting factor 1